ncbi:hypothetical protein [Microbulbifer epialgicus]|uniref:Uncharacterized protein n=1 Tax=Microbulbifer epialgicus TaxID=393907 RepID=A0ABV4NT57_9GAMM
MKTNRIHFWGSISIPSGLSSIRVNAVGLEINKSECGEHLKLHIVTDQGNVLPGGILIPLNGNFICECCEALLTHTQDTSSIDVWDSISIPSNGNEVTSDKLEIIQSECGKYLNLRVVSDKGNVLPGGISIPSESNSIRECCEALLAHTQDDADIDIKSTSQHSRIRTEATETLLR